MTDERAIEIFKETQEHEFNHINHIGSSKYGIYMDDNLKEAIKISINALNKNNIQNT